MGGGRRGCGARREEEGWRGAARVLVCLGWLTTRALPHAAGPSGRARRRAWPRSSGEVLASVALLLGARGSSGAPDGVERGRVEAVAAADGRGDDHVVEDGGDDLLLAGQRQRRPRGPQARPRCRRSSVERGRAVERRRALARDVQALLDRLARAGSYSGTVICRSPYIAASSSSCAWSRCSISACQPAPSASSGAAVQRRGELGRVEPVQDGLGDERLQRLGDDRRSCRSRRSPGRSRRHSGGCRPSAAARPAARRSGRSAAGREAGSGGRSGSCAARDRSACARSRCVSAGVMIACHSAFATISPWCSRWPLIRADISIRRNVCGRPPRPRSPSRHRARSVGRRSSAGSRPRASARQHSRIDRRLGRGGRSAGRPRTRTAACRHRTAARLRQLLVLAPDPAALVVALLPRHGTQDTSHELPVVRRQDRCRRVTDASSSRGRWHSRRTPPTPAAAGAAGQVAHDDRVDRRASISSSIRRYSGRSLPLYALTSASTYRSATCQPAAGQPLAIRQLAPIARLSPSRSDEIRA